MKSAAARQLRMAQSPRLRIIHTTRRAGGAGPIRAEFLPVSTAAAGTRRRPRRWAVSIAARGFASAASSSSPANALSSLMPALGPAGSVQQGVKSAAATLATNAATAAAAYEDDDDEVQLYDAERSASPSTDRSRSERQSNSRLDRLRQQLRQEDKEKVPVVLSSWSSKHVKPSSHLNDSSDTSHQQRNAVPSDLASLRAWLQTMPEPDMHQVLVDTFQRRHSYLRISLTERCNLRCTYCMPPEGVPLQPASHLLRTDEILQLCEVFADLGATKFRLTGGEPTLRSDIVDVVRGIKALQPHLIGMTSNGIKLVKQLPDLVEAGLDSLNLSLDTLQPDKFERMTRRPAANLYRVLQALETAHDVYAIPSSNSVGEDVPRPRLTVKLNCVVMRGINDDEVPDFIRLVERYPALQVRFIEYMPFDANGWKTSLLVPYRELLERLEHAEKDHGGPSLALDPVPSDDPHDTTKWFSIRGSAADDADAGRRQRQVGFITSMSSHFCNSCNRLRLTADGQLKSCLFDGGEVSLRDALRGTAGGLGNSDDVADPWTTPEIRKLIHYGAVLPKKQALGGHESPQEIHEDARRNRPMTLIGG